MYDYDECPHECSACEDKQDKLAHAADHMVAVVEILYGNGSLDVAKLEWHLDEVQWALGMQLTPQAEMPKVERKHKTIFNLTTLSAKIA